MKFEEVLPALREGKKVRRKNDRVWENNYGFIFIKDGKIVSDNVDNDKYILAEKDLNADDWELIEIHSVKLRDLTEEQFERYCNSTCEKKCNTCVFCYVNCLPGSVVCWIKHKDLYSDKFLDQEIEIEE